MNSDIKTRWLKALRSGDFKQGTAQLKRTDDSYCCLGVLCNIAVSEGVCEEKIIHDDGRTFISFGKGNSTSETILPLVVMEWAGIEDSDPAVNIVVDGLKYRTTLAELNDAGESFDSIADLIETNL